MNQLKEEVDSRMKSIEDNASEKTKQKLQKKQKKIDDISEADIDQQIETLEKENKKLKHYQRILDALQEKMEIDSGRVMGLTDGIFSIVMTLLIFGITLPSTEILTDAGLSSFISSILPNIGVTLVSFILLASFWIYHHEFIKLKSLNLVYLWLSMFYLAALCFIPFTTTLIGTYPEFRLSTNIFGINILLVIIFFLLMLNYASKRGFLDEEVIEKDKKYVHHTLYIILAFAVIINVLDFSVNKNFIYLFFLVPIISTIRDVRFKLKNTE